MERRNTMSLLTKDEEKILFENQNLIHYAIRRWGMTPNSDEYDDFLAIGNIALMNAIKRYDASNKSKASLQTYALKCIYNSFVSYYRANKRDDNTISMEESEGNSEDDLKYEQKIPSPDSYFEQKILENIEVVEILSIIVNYFSKKEKLIMLYIISDITIRNVAKIMNISRSEVFRIKKKCIEKIRDIINYNIQYEKNIDISSFNNIYRIVFNNLDSSEQELVVSFLKKLNYKEMQVDFQYNYKTGKMTIYLKDYPEKFLLLARIFDILN